MIQFDLGLSLPHPTAEGSIQYWPGYAWHVGREEVWEWAWGFVATPRWARRVAPTHAVMLDNGAFPAWRDGITLTGREMFLAQRDAIADLGGRVRWAIAPDIVAGGEDSWRRSLTWAPELQALGVEVLLPVQEGQHLRRCAEQAQEMGAGLFVGGATKGWKIAAARRLREFAPDAHIHVGRVALAGHLQRLAGVIDSFDSTYWVRAQEHNKRRSLTEITPFLTRPPGAVSEEAAA